MIVSQENHSVFDWIHQHSINFFSKLEINEYVSVAL